MRKYKKIARAVLCSSTLPTIISALIISVGLILSLFGFETAFQRSGAVLVSLAIASLAINNFLALELEFADSLNQLINIKTPEEALLLAEKHIKDEPNLDVFVQNSMDGKRTQSVKIHNEIIDLQKLEFTAAFFGTLIWAFGDIPFCA